MMHGQKNIKSLHNLIDNTNKCASNKMYIFTYNPLRLWQVSVFFRSSSGILHQTSIYKIQIKYQTDTHLYRNIKEKLYTTNASISFKTKNFNPTDTSSVFHICLLEVNY